MSNTNITRRSWITQAIVASGAILASGVAAITGKLSLPVRSQATKREWNSLCIHYDLPDGRQGGMTAAWSFSDKGRQQIAAAHTVYCERSTGGYDIVKSRNSGRKFAKDFGELFKILKADRQVA